MEEVEGLSPSISTTLILFITSHLIYRSVHVTYCYQVAPRVVFEKHHRQSAIL